MDYKILCGQYKQLDDTTTEKLKLLFNSNNPTKFKKNLRSAKDEVFYESNMKMFIMVCPPSTIKFSCIAPSALTKCKALYNFMFNPNEVKENLAICDALMKKVFEKYPNLIMFLPVDPASHDVLHPVMAHLAGKFNKGNMTNFMCREFTTMPLTNLEQEFSPDLRYYDPIGNVISMNI
jgi:hypothetical protein